MSQNSEQWVRGESPVEPEDMAKPRPSIPVLEHSKQRDSLQVPLLTLATTRLKPHLIWKEHDFSSTRSLAPLSHSSSSKVLLLPDIPDHSFVTGPKGAGRFQSTPS